MDYTIDMKEIQEQFNLLKEGSLLGDYILFASIIKNKNYPDGTIMKCFKRLVNKNEYEKKDIPLIRKHLNKITKK